MLVAAKLDLAEESYQSSSVTRQQGTGNSNQSGICEAQRIAASVATIEMAARIGLEEACQCYVHS